MNRTATIVLLLLCSTFINAQGLFKYFKWTAYTDGPEKVDHIVVDIKHDRFLQHPSGIEQSNYSVGANVYAFHDAPLNKKSTLSFGIGIGFSGSNYHNNGRFAYSAGQDNTLTTQFLPYPDELDIRKNKLNLNFLEIPLELRIRSWTRKVDQRIYPAFRLYLGFKGGYLISNHTKFRDADTKIKEYNIKNLLQYRYGPTVRLGFKKISLFGFYSLTPVFQDGLGPKMFPISFGVSWIRL